MHNAETLWESCYPGVDFAEASPEDRVMFENHADSLNMYSDQVEQED